MSNHPCQGKSEALLTHARLLEVAVYNRRTGLFTARITRGGIRAGTVLGSLDANGYRRIMIDRRRFMAHRLAWFYVKRVWPRDELDHRDENKDNNRFRNLREATCAQNHAAAHRKPGRARLRGAHWSARDGSWQSSIGVSGRKVHLGRFRSAKAAHAAYVRGARHYHAKSARTQ
jgi:hypothetical protein